MVLAADTTCITIPPPLPFAVRLAAGVCRLHDGACGGRAPRAVDAVSWHPVQSSLHAGRRVCRVQPRVRAGARCVLAPVRHT
eukprot:2922-Chlamydomonas_euryale.AAC.1